MNFGRVAVLSDEASIEAIYREVKEEIGIKIDKSEMHLIAGYEAKNAFLTFG